MSGISNKVEMTKEQIQQMKANFNAFKTYFYDLKAEFDSFKLHFGELEADWARIMASLESQESDENISCNVSVSESRQDFNALNDFKSYADENQKQTISGFSFGSAFSKLKEKAGEAKEAIERSGMLDKVKEKTSELANKGLEKGRGFVESQKQK